MNRLNAVKVDRLQMLYIQCSFNPLYEIVYIALHHDTPVSLTVCPR